MPPPLAQAPVQDRAVDRRANPARLLHIPRPFALWHLFSLDAPTVAVVWSLAFAWTARIHVAGRALVVLALTAWCAYVGDRLLDARAGLHSPTGSTLHERHFFHWRHRRLLALLGAAAACVAGAIAMTLLSSAVLERGLVLGAAVLVYLLGVHAAPRVLRLRRSIPRLLFSKELLVAVLFTAGCILPAWSRLNASATPEPFASWFWIAAAYFAALAWLNCSLIARWEADGDNDARDGRATFARAKLRTKQFVALSVAFAGVLLAILAFSSSRRPAALLLAGAVSALLMALLDRMRPRMTPLTVRTTADLVLLAPLLLLG